jgi:hypothetical protein
MDTIYLQAEDGLVVDQVANTTSDNNTQVRDPSNREVVQTGKILDAQGLRPGYSGDGYVDFGLNAGSAGDSLTFLGVNVPEAGTYTLHFRYANGGTAPRPLALTVNGAAAPPCRSPMPQQAR